jgi:hypothetical protein
VEVICEITDSKEMIERLFLNKNFVERPPR